MNNAISNLILDTNEINILSLTLDKEIYLQANGETRKYKPIINNDGSWDLIDINDDNVVYDLSCTSFKELRAMLLVDYATGILTKAYY